MDYYTILHYIAEGNLDRAFEYWLSESEKETHYNNEVLLLSCRYHFVRNLFQRGVISANCYVLEINQIANTLIHACKRTT